MITIRTITERSGKDRRWQREATHCIHGHEYAVVGVDWHEEGWRRCSECRRIRKRERDRRQRSALSCA